jgi:hypothetical protein
MFGLGYQELLLIVVILFMYVTLIPGVFYLLVYVLLWMLKSPRLVLLALWLLGIVYGIAAPNLTLAILAPVGIALAFAWLWFAGLVWQRIGLVRIGTVWRGMASLHFRSLLAPT